MKNNTVNKKTGSRINQKFFRSIFHLSKRRVKVPEDDFIMSPKVDFAFKELMKNEMVRMGFLSAILEISPNDIKSTKLLDTHLRKQYEEDKQGILDVRICMNDDTEIDIEIQLAKVDVWAERSIFYLSKMYTDQIKKGKKYGTAHKCICISVLDFVLFPEYEGYYSRFHIWEDTRKEKYTDKIEFHIIELPKLMEVKKYLDVRNDTDGMDEAENAEDLRTLWGLFMNAESKEEFTMIARKNSFLSAAFEHLQLISYSERKRREYDARERAMLDHDAFVTQLKKNRKEAEASKKEAEANKKEAEANKKEAEANKKEAEANKKEAEANRKRAEEAEKLVEELKRQLEEKQNG